LHSQEWRRDKFPPRIEPRRESIGFLTSDAAAIGFGVGKSRSVRRFKSNSSDMIATTHGSVTDFKAYQSCTRGTTNEGIPSELRGRKADTQKIESNMRQLLQSTAASAAALSALAFITFATPASAGEYCRKDITSAMVSCSFDNMAQCQAMSSGRGGDCFRDPFLAETRNVLAYAPKTPHAGAAIHRHRHAN
jgi:hypothetical protein